MQDDQIQNAHERQDRVRQCAYYLWQADGCPHGRHHEYWQRAEALIGIEDSAAGGQPPAIRSEPQTASGTKEKTVKARDIPEPPDSAPDQPARKPTSKARGRARQAKTATTQPNPR